MSKAMKYLSAILFLVICVIVYFIYSSIDRNKADEKEVTPEEFEKELWESLTELEVYFDENQGDMEALDEIVYHHYILGNTDKAYELGLKLIGKEPDNPDHYHTIANIKMKTKEWEEMIDYREQAHHLANTSDTLYYLSTSYLVTDANYSLALLSDLDDYYLDIETDFLFRYEAALGEYIKNKNFQTIEGLIEFIPDNVLVEEIIQDAITNSTSSEEISKLKALKGELDEY